MFGSGAPIVVEFPLRGEWNAPTTPGTRVPSHGTDMLGTRYAYDFLQVDWDRKGWPCYRSGFVRYALAGIPLSDCYCYGQQVHAPFDGVVVGVETECTERQRVSLVSEVRRLREDGRYDPAKDDLKVSTGNSVVVENRNGVCAGLVHLQPHSVCVQVGQEVRQGDVLGSVGHSGNSMFPHLHFQLMDHADARIAQGLPCAFERYEVFEEGEWREVRAGIPTRKDRIRFEG